MEEYRLVATLVRHNGEVDVFIERFPTENLAIIRSEQMREAFHDPCHFDKGVPKHCDFTVEPVEI